MNKTVARYIIRAQIASDGGKHIEDLCSISERDWVLGYNIKDNIIYKAISLIDKKAHSGFAYYVKHGDIYNSYIIYFNFKIEGVRKQVSFHSFNRNKFEKFCREHNKFSTRWNKGSSRQTVFELYSHIEAQ